MRSFRFLATVVFASVSIVALAGCSSETTFDGGTADGGSQDSGPLTAWVNPFIGTGGLGFSVGSMTPAANVPNGLVNIGPDTQSPTGASSFYHCAGYYYDDEIIQGFSHIHLPGIGVPDLGNILFMPVTGMDEKKISVENYRSRFSKSNETARPGYYSVILDEGDITAELTATTRAAAHRYTWPAAAADRTVVIDLSHALPGNSVKDAQVAIDTSAGTVAGVVRSMGGMAGRFGGPLIYFNARFNKPIMSTGTWKNQDYLPGTTAQSGDTIGTFIGFGPSDGVPVEAQVGISYVDAEGALRNRTTEMPDWGFDAIARAADASWEKELSVVRVEGGTNDERRMFYTALYHVMQSPTIFNDVDGRYMGIDKKIHTAEGFSYYTNFSMWDTYRTLHPLLVLLVPDRVQDMMKSLILMYEQGGALPRWPIAGGEGGSMIGDSADIIITDAYIKGITGFDAQKALQGMLLTADNPDPKTEYGGRGGLTEYLSLGYCAADKSGEGVSLTQEYAYDDFAISQLAGALGDTATRDRFIARSKYYANTFDKTLNFFVGRNADGSFITDFTDIGWDHRSYCEGDAWQYRFFVPFDIPGLAALFGGNGGLIAAMDDLFSKSYEEQKTRKDAWLYPNYYWQGNEPDIHTAYAYNEAGRPDLAQRWARWIAKALYGPGPAGLPGNDDCGTMSAWYMFTAMGFYAVPARDVYMTGSPIFSRIELNLKGGKMVIEAPGASKNNIYVPSAALGGKALAKPWFTHGEISGGGKIRFVMGDAPSTWGRF
ncbi:MAG: GH92 family glycosyl hydrolase [Myxococcota bacterium]|jgi:predicted alpha-1,2-mannosidase